MYIRVKLLNGFRESLTYTIPDSWNAAQIVGSIVEVPLQKRTEAAFVEAAFTKLDEQPSYSIRTAISQEIIPSDIHYKTFIEKLSAYHALDALTFFKRIRHFLQEKEHGNPPACEIFECETPTLTSEQQAIVDHMVPALEQGTYYPALLHGVTGSGKTEIYKSLIMNAYDRKKSALFLVPEVSLAVTFTQRLKMQLPGIPVYSFHSATSIKEKKILWQRLLAHEPTVIVGVHLPILLPIPHLGLIIIDEEHDQGFQEKKHPRVHTKEAAFLRAQISGLAIIAGSATPSITSLYNVRHRGWHYFSLKKRFAGEFPTISVVKLTDQKTRKNFWLSSELEEALKQQVSKKEQTIIFLNRRGYSFFVQCKECGFIPQCRSCSVSLTLHAARSGIKAHDAERLMCHYCSFTEKVPFACSSCNAPASSLIKKGIGTQQVVTLLEKLVPHARIARADLDTTINKKKWMQTIQDFEAGHIDILVGTQTITKGYHFPRVTLVGVLWADLHLGLPMYNAAEITLQQLIQVAGRAGRQSADSRVIIQTMLDHDIYDYLDEEDYEEFYIDEMEKRAIVGYPPLIRLAEIELKHQEENIVSHEAYTLAQALKSSVQRQHLNAVVLGPSQPPVHKIKNVCSRKIYIKAPTMTHGINLYNAINKAIYTSAIFFTPNPLS